MTEDILFSLQHIDKVFKHKELQQQLVDTKLQQTTQLIKEADKKHQREREFVSSVSVKKKNYHQIITKAIFSILYIYLSHTI